MKKLTPSFDYFSKNKKVRYSLIISVSLLLLITLFVLPACNRSEKAERSNNKSYFLDQLTSKEKVSLLGGVIMSTKPIPRLGIPSIRMSDGPLGVRWGHATSFPSGIALASSWDTSLLREVGRAIGREVRGKGRNIILGPNVNIARNPLNGRTFEGFGEDPFLTSLMGVSYILGVQEEGVGATVKHFVANSQEFHRFTIDEKIDERTLREIYFPAFKAAVQKAHVIAVMAAYNEVNGQFCSANHFLLNTVLRNEWGYKGLIMSDWSAVHNTFPTVNNALDLEMPTGKYLNKKTLLPAIQSKKIKLSTIDSKVNNILNTAYRIQLLPKMKHPQHLVDSLLNSSETKQTALQAAIEGIVLLKNKRNLLPLRLNKKFKIAIIGPNAAFARTVGGGSAEVQPYFAISPLEALEKSLKGKAELQYSPGILFPYPIPVEPRYFYIPETQKNGLKAEFFPNDSLKGKPIVKYVNQIDYRQGGAQETPIASSNGFKGPFSVRWTGRLKAPLTGKYTFRLASGGPVVMYLNEKKVFERKKIKGSESIYNPEKFEVSLIKNHQYDIKIEYIGRQPYNPDKGTSLLVQLSWLIPEKTSIKDAAQLASKADIALVFVGTSANYESEGYDMPSLRLPENQDELIKEVAAKNKNTVVILITGAPVEMGQWVAKVPAILQTWFDGEYIGTAIAQILTGKENPSGKLPITFPKSWRQEPLSIQNYRNNDSLLSYSEGIYVGYRYFDTKNITPLFPFGYGLSYTTFKYSNLKLDKKATNGQVVLNVSFDITNTGKRKGNEIAQVYVHEENPKIDRPVKELKGFVRVSLHPGETKTVNVKLNNASFQYFDPNTKKWTMDEANFDILVGSSSRDILLKRKISLPD